MVAGAAASLTATTATLTASTATDPIFAAIEALDAKNYH
jgi:hypothetical protein